MHGPGPSFFVPGPTGLTFALVLQPDLLEFLMDIRASCPSQQITPVVPALSYFTFIFIWTHSPRAPCAEQVHTMSTGHADPLIYEES